MDTAQKISGDVRTSHLVKEEVVKPIARSLRSSRRNARQPMFKEKKED
jgi:hypothetical protein